MMLVSMKLVVGSPFYNFTDELEWSRLIEFLNSKPDEVVACFQWLFVVFFLISLYFAAYGE